MEAASDPGWSLEDPGARLVDPRLGRLLAAAAADQMAVLNHRTRTHIHRAIQMSAGLLVVLVVVVCVATLATHSPSSPRHRLISNLERRKVMMASDAAVIRRSSVGIQDVFISVKTASKIIFSFTTRDYL